MSEFDGHRGLGTVVARDGQAFPFHCTSIADGSRTIDEGTAVTFVIVPGHRGQWEAAAIAPAEPTI